LRGILRGHACSAIAVMPHHVAVELGRVDSRFRHRPHGRQAIWVCTAAVEAAVHRHLDDQLAFLAGRDAELHDTIMSIREEELSHLHHAESQIASLGRGSRLLRRFISDTTDVLIWLSTWGDSTRMIGDLRKATS
jgi:3-demethoxyubiquinol 3-hydroxylase